MKKAIFLLIFLWIQLGFSQKKEILSNYNISNVAIFSENGYYGITNENGIETTESKFDTIYKSEQFCYSKLCQCFIGEKSSNFFLISYDGYINIPIPFDNLWLMTSGENNRYRGVFNDTVYLIRSNGEVITKEYQDMYYGGSSSIFAIKNNKIGLIDIENNVEIDFEYDYLRYSGSRVGELIAEKNGKFGLIDLNNQITLPFEFDQLIATLGNIGENGDEFVVEQNGKMGTISVKSDSWEYVIKPEYDAISGWCCGGPDGHYIVKNKKEGFLDDNGKIYFEPIFDGISVTSGGFMIQEDEKIGIFNYLGDTILPVEYDLIFVDAEPFYFYPEDTIDDKFVVLKNDKWMYFTLYGEQISENVDKLEIEKKYPYLISGN